MIKLHCDCCDKVVPEEGLTRVTADFHIGSEYHHINHELCEDCLIAFKIIVSKFKEMVHENIGA